MIIIDTNLAIHACDGHAVTTQKLTQRGSTLAIALPTLIELEGGVYANAVRTKERRATLDRLLLGLKVLELSRDIIAAYGQIIAACGFSRPRIIDRLIAATAIVHGLTLVTMNGPDFRDISGLSLEVWPAPGQ